MVFDSILILLHGLIKQDISQRENCGYSMFVVNRLMCLKNKYETNVVNNVMEYVMKTNIITTNCGSVCPRPLNNIIWIELLM